MATIYKYGDYALYALGSNGSGQLGIGNNEDSSRPLPVTEQGYGATPKFPRNIRQLVAGGNHTVILCDPGHVWACGENKDGRIGAKEGEPADTIRLVRSSWPRVKPGFSDHIAATWSATIFTESDGTKVVSYGNGNSGELGYGPDIRSRHDVQNMESFLPDGVRIVQLASCMAHVVAVLSNGEVYGWGKGRKGQLGEPAEDVWTPRKIDGILFRAVKAVCGKDFTCIFGAPANGELLILGPTRNDRFRVKVDAPSNVRGWVDVQASWGSVYVLLESGKIVAWGRNDHGQLPPPDLPSIAKISAGSEHCLALTTDDRALAWGWGEHGNCGAEIDEAGDVKGGRWNELNVPGKPVDVFAGCATSFIATRFIATVDQQNGARPASKSSEG